MKQYNGNFVNSSFVIEKYMLFIHTEIDDSNVCSKKV